MSDFGKTKMFILIVAAATAVGLSLIGLFLPLPGSGAKPGDTVFIGDALGGKTVYHNVEVKDVSEGSVKFKTDDGRFFIYHGDFLIETGN